SVDHIIPLDHGGAPFTLSNLRVVHFSCNSGRGTGRRKPRNTARPPVRVPRAAPSAPPSAPDADREHDGAFASATLTSMRLLGIVIGAPLYGAGGLARPAPAPSRNSL